MPKTKLQNVVFTAIMAIFMVYGMIVYNVALNTGGVHGETFLLAFHELYIMAPIAFILEFFVVDKVAHMLAFSFMKPDDRLPREKTVNHNAPAPAQAGTGAFSFTFSGSLRPASGTSGRRRRWQSPAHAGGCGAPSGCRWPCW